MARSDTSRHVATAVLIIVCFALTQAVAQRPDAYPSLRHTRCNTDPSRGQVNDPCGSLYDAVCRRTHCACPRGTVENTVLRRCVAIPDRAHDVQQGHDDLDDLPFEYTPPGGRRGNSGNAGGQQRGISRTLCNANHPTGGIGNPCPSLYNAVCIDNHCHCPEGTIENNDTHKCESIHGPEKLKEEDDNDDDDDDDDDSGTGDRIMGSQFSIMVGFVGSMLVRQLMMHE